MTQPAENHINDVFFKAYSKYIVSEKELNSISILKLIKRRKLRQHIQSVEGDTYLQNLANEVANHLIDNKFRKIRKTKSPRNPYHKEVELHLPSLAEMVSTALLKEQPFTRQPAPVTGGRTWQNFSPVANKLSVKNILSILKSNYESVQKVSNDDHYMVRTGTNDDVQYMFIQHAASGLRAKFEYSLISANKIGFIHSNPEFIKSLARDDDHNNISEEWEFYTGLGIGKKIYLKAAQEWSSVRWGSSGSITPAAETLRARLHKADPYKWNSYCKWCDDHNIIWTAADKKDFKDHP